MDLLSLSGSTAVVIGASSGIGRVLALGLAQAGADVVATARRQVQVDAVTREISALGRRTFSQTSDVSDSASLERLRSTREKKNRRTASGTPKKGPTCTITPHAVEARSF